MANKQEEDDDEAAWQDWDVESEEGSSDDESDGWINVGSEGEDDIDISDSEEENDKKKKKKRMMKVKKKKMMRMKMQEMKKKLKVIYNKMMMNQQVMQFNVYQVLLQQG